MGREWVSHKVIAGVIVGMTITHILWLKASQPTEPTQIEAVEAYNMGKQHALSTNPVSMDLEMTCVSLWMSKQTPNE
jgi:flagellar basal body rod protein FlgB